MNAGDPLAAMQRPSMDVQKWCEKGPLDFSTIISVMHCSHKRSHTKTPVGERHYDCLIGQKKKFNAQQSSWWKSGYSIESWYNMKKWKRVHNTSWSCVGFLQFEHWKMIAYHVVDRCEQELVIASMICASICCQLDFFRGQHGSHHDDWSWRRAPCKWLTFTGEFILD